MSKCCNKCKARPSPRFNGITHVSNSAVPCYCPCHQAPDKEECFCASKHVGYKIAHLPNCPMFKEGMQNKDCCTRCDRYRIDGGTGCILEECKCHFPDKENNWREEFRRKFGDKLNHVPGNMPIIATGTKLIEIERYISNLLSTQRESILEKVRQMKVNGMNSNDNIYSLEMEEGYNLALSDLEAYLTKK